MRLPLLVRVARERRVACAVQDFSSFEPYIRIGRYPGTLSAYLPTYLTYLRAGLFISAMRGPRAGGDMCKYAYCSVTGNVLSLVVCRCTVYVPTLQEFGDMNV